MLTVPDAGRLGAKEAWWRRGGGGLNSYSSSGLSYICLGRAPELRRFSFRRSMMAPQKARARGRPTPIATPAMAPPLYPELVFADAHADVDAPVAVELAVADAVDVDCTADSIMAAT